MQVKSKRGKLFRNNNQTRGNKYKGRESEISTRLASS